MTALYDPLQEQRPAPIELARHEVLTLIREVPRGWEVRNQSGDRWVIDTHDFAEDVIVIARPIRCYIGRNHAHALLGLIDKLMPAGVVPQWQSEAIDALRAAIADADLES